LETVEADLAKRQAEKDSLNNQIIQLNKKMTKLNNNIALLSQQVRL
jgi:predicted  nucleic acid-binding Zn-ribbon protein